MDHNCSQSVIWKSLFTMLSIGMHIAKRRRTSPPSVMLQTRPPLTRPSIKSTSSGKISWISFPDKKEYHVPDKDDDEKHRLPSIELLNAQCKHEKEKQEYATE